MKSKHFIILILIVSILTSMYIPVSAANNASATNNVSTDYVGEIPDNTGIRITNDLIIKNVPNGLNPIQYYYDESGYNKGVTDPQGNKEIFEYDSKGRIKNVTIKDINGNVILTTIYVYDIDSPRIKKVTTKDSMNNAILDLDYKYDKNENCLLERDNINKTSREFTYGDNDELTEEKFIDKDDKVIQTTLYSYDNAGNRIKKSVNLNGNNIDSNYAYNSDNQITSVDGKQLLTYDADGNIIFDGKGTNVFNDKNQLIEAQQKGSTIESYKYNDNGLRTEKVADGEKKVYNYNGKDVIWISDANKKLNYFFTRDAKGRLLNMVDYTTPTPTTYWYLLDGFGNVVGLADGSSSNIVRYSYDAWGNINNVTGDIKTGNGRKLSDENPFGYIGYQYDKATGYYFLNSRYYDPAVGRFITPDSYKDHPNDPINKNLYLYCANNPIKYYDPSGNMYLAVGSTGNDVITLQCKLKFMRDKDGIMYYSGAIDGDYGAGTQAAVQWFQSNYGLDADGIVGDATWGILDDLIPGDFILANGSTGITVTILQQKLIEAGYLTGQADGIFGSITEAAVNVYKDSLDLSNTDIYRGKVGLTTWNYLLNIYEGAVAPIRNYGVYTVVNKNSSLVLDVANGSTDDSANVLQYGDSGHAWQRWILVDAGGGYYKLVNQNSNKLLEVHGGSIDNAANVEQFSDNGGAWQLWKPISVGGGYYKLVNCNSGKLLEVHGGSTEYGANVEQFSDNCGTWQLWKLNYQGTSYPAEDFDTTERDIGIDYFQPSGDDMIISAPGYPSITWKYISEDDYNNYLNRCQGDMALPGSIAWQVNRDNAFQYSEGNTLYPLIAEELALLYHYDPWGVKLYLTARDNGILAKDVFILLTDREPKFYSIIDGSWYESDSDTGYSEADACLKNTDYPVTLLQIATAAFSVLIASYVTVETVVFIEGVAIFGFRNALTMWSYGVLDINVAYWNGLNGTTNAVNMADDVIDLAQGTWQKGWIDRGNTIDTARGNNLGYNFPVVDRLQNRILTSTKSLDTAAPTYQNGSTMLSKTKSFVNQLNGFTRREWNGVVVETSDYSSKTLELVIPDIQLSGQQMQAIIDAKTYAQSFGITLTIIVGR